MGRSRDPDRGYPDHPALVPDPPRCGHVELTAAQATDLDAELAAVA